MEGRLGGCLTSRGGIGRKTVNSLVDGKRVDVLGGFVEGTREGRNGKEAGRLAAQTVLQTAGGSAKPQGPSRGVWHTRSRKLMEECQSIGPGMATGPLVAGGLNPRRKPVAEKVVKGPPRKRTTRRGSHPDDVSVGAEDCRPHGKVEGEETGMGPPVLVGEMRSGTAARQGG